MSPAVQIDDDDSLAWSRVVEGDPAALERLCAEWLPVALQWCRRLGGPRVDADQATQEVFLVVLRRIHTVRSAEAFPAWLMAVTRRVLAQLRRQAWPNRWEPGVSLDSLSTGEVGEGGERRDRAVRAWAVLSGMPDDMRELLVLCDIEQRTDAEAAAVLELPLGTVKSRLRRARHVFTRRARGAGLLPPLPPETP
jgi:RNA polymerase sigma-70 factor (ECF subfamily)